MENPENLHETTLLLGQKDDRDGRANKNSPAHAVALIMIVFGVVFLFSSNGVGGLSAGLMKGPTSTDSETILRSGMTNDGDDDRLTIKIWNEYGDSVNSIKYNFYKWTEVVEPHRVTTLRIETDESHCKRGDWQWTLKMRNANYSKFSHYIIPTLEDETPINFISSSLETTFNFTQAGRYYDLSAQCSTNSMMTATVTVICKYVRRELRTLNPVDAKNFLDAIDIMYHSRLEEGREIYGSNFYSVEWYTRWHLGSPSANSPWHASPVFFTSHAIFGNHFERSLQSIYPSLAAHYWDFTIDAALSVNWNNSFFWSKEWFGPHTSHDIANMHKATQGRWANIAIGRNRTGYNTHNSYGLINEPYNNNPSNVLTRSFSICGMPTTAMSLPSCTELAGTFTQTSMTDFHSTTEYDLHVELHPLFGGAWDCEASLVDTPEAMRSSLNYVVRDLTNYYIMNYYDDTLSCPSYCSLDTAFTDCRCTCSELSGMLSESSLSNDQWYNLFEKVVANKTITATMPMRTSQILRQNSKGKWKFKGLSEEENAMMYETTSMLVCYPGRIGQFMGPLDSANDPIFFPTHINWERNWNYMRLRKDFNSTWGNGVNWGSVTGWAFDDPVEPFTNAYGNFRKEGYFTNRELVDLFDPNLDMLPFIWDDLSWKHCRESGIDTSSH